jgi:hypothetical protein
MKMRMKTTMKMMRKMKTRKTTTMRMYQQGLRRGRLVAADSQPKKPKFLRLVRIADIIILIMHSVGSANVYIYCEERVMLTCVRITP